MKRFLLYLAVFALAFTTTSCDPPQYAWSWSVKNTTEQVLNFKYILHYHKDSDFYGSYGTVTIHQDDAITIYDITTETGKRHRMHFSDYFKRSADSYGENVYWQILSEDNIVLKTWNYYDKDLPGQRFFEESSWHSDQKPGDGAFIETEYSWTFDILPEDIQQVDQ